MAKRHRRSRKTTSNRSLFDESSSNGGNGQFVALHETARDRYLNYALSVITSRALPDVRDGLKPVQRRILYSMWQQGITANAKHRKCAKVVGDVMGSYHPHGDTAIYDALVRLAQPFSMRVPLIDGSGNFGSLDGDRAAAMRYTECRLAPVAAELISEIARQTVHFQPNYDGTTNEPIVLPTRIPNLLVNGATGIAVGMATNIPPHNLGEVCIALLKLLDKPELKTHELCSTIKGPDFPTGGQLITSKEQLRHIYKTGSGVLKLRATHAAGPATRSTKTIRITSMPYTVNKSQLVERIAEIVLSRKMPLLVNVKDLSANDVQIELELKKDADVKKVLAYLYKHTSLQINYNINLTCLIPTENPQVGRPQRCDLREMLQHFLMFRLDVVTRRLEHELGQLKSRIHILEGFIAVFDALDKIIKMIRTSNGKQDAAAKMIKSYRLDEDQAEAILELKLYRLAKLEILVIRDELKKKRKRAKSIQQLLLESEATGRWSIVRNEIQEVFEKYGKTNTRHTHIEVVIDEPEFTADDFIIAEDNHVLVTRDGWVKRQKEIRDPTATRLREGDSVLACEGGSTRATIMFCSNFGVAYTRRVIDIPATTGYGEPIQKLFKLKDGEKIVAAFSLDPRAIGSIQINPDEPSLAPLVHAIAVSSNGYALRFGFEPFVEPSTRSGRRFARPTKGIEIVDVKKIHGTETVIAASRNARVVLCSAEEVNYLAGPGKGVILMKVAKDDRLLGFITSKGHRELMTVETSRGSIQNISTAKYEVTSRGGKGREILKRGYLKRIVPDEPSPPMILNDDK